MTKKKPGSVCAIIPARGGSKGIPRKNMLKIGGFPLIAYSIAAARMCPSIDSVVVSTDDTEIAAAAKEWGASVPFLRPAEISGDDSTDKEFMEHFYQYLIGDSLELPELVVHLRPTTPFRCVDSIERAIGVMREPGYSSLRSMQLTALTPYKLFYRNGEFANPILTKDGCVESYNLPRQHFPQTYQPNGVVDIVRPEVLLNTGLIHGEQMYLYEVPACPDIDGYDDLQDAERVVNDINYQPLFKYLTQITE